MADREQPYDPYIPAGSNPSGSAPPDGNHRTAALQAVGGFFIVHSVIAIRYRMIFHMSTLLFKLEAL